MDYGVIPGNFLERLALWSGKVPIPALDVLVSIVKARSIMAGVRLGLFEALAAGPATAKELASRCGLDVANTGILARALVFNGYLEQKGEEFSLSSLARQTLVPGAPQDLTGFVAWNINQWDMLAQLEKVIQTGRGLDFHHTMEDPHLWSLYQQAMFDIARLQAPTVVAKVPLPRGAQSMLDVAGSHGFFAASFCRRHPPLRATVLELPAAIEHARALAEAAGHADLVDYRAGDLLVDDWGRGPSGQGFDLVFLANILHHFEPTQVSLILAKAFASLRPGGTVAIWEIDVPNPQRKADLGDLGVLFFRLTSSARCYRGEDYADFLREAGGQQTRVRRMLTLPGSVLVHARSLA